METLGAFIYNKHCMDEVIVALATPPLKSALAIVRASGEDCLKILEEIYTAKLDLSKDKQVYFGYIKDEEETIDQCVVIVYTKPHGYTGENACEIMCHGSVNIANRIIEAFIKRGARLAERGEFSERAYLNNKIDLMQAEAVNDLIDAKTKEAQNLALLGLKGDNSKLVKPLRNKLADLLALLEVNIDFPEYEDIEVANVDKIIKEAKKMINLIDNLVQDGLKAKIIIEGVKVMLIGHTNVGKSSLLNALLNEEKAIVTSIEGTTRDIVDGEMNYQGVTFHFYDTAGLRENTSEIELIGIKKAKKLMKEMDYIVYVLDDINQEEPLHIDKKKIIKVVNKSELVKNRNKDYIYVSAKKRDVKPLLDELMKRLNLEKDNFKNPSINNARAIALLNKTKNALKQVIKDATLNLPIDIISVSLQEAYACVLAILGEDHDQGYEEEIFSRFCVGK